MKRFLCWCIWLLLSSLVVGGQWSVIGKAAVVSGRWLVVGKNTNQTPTIAPSQPATDHRSPATDHLPCADSSPTCLQQLGDLAVQQSRELTVLKEAIRLQQKKRWTTWLSADGLHPLTIGLRIARNIAGGGDRAAMQLELSRLELRQAEMESTLRQAVTRAVLEYEAAERQCAAAASKLTSLQARVAFLSVAYRLGEGSTEAMLQLWQTESEFQHELERAQLHLTQCHQQLQALILPPPNRVIAASPTTAKTK